MNPFDSLRHSFALTAGNSLVPGASGYSVGAVVTLLPTEEFGWKFIEEHRKDIEGLGMGDPELVSVDDPWKLMRRAAGEGLAGFQCVAPQSPDSFMFMVRVEEAGSALPTVLGKFREDGNLDCLTRSGPKSFSHAQLLHWERYDIIDRVTARWVQRCPFRGWNHGDLLYELTAVAIVVLLADVPLMGNWNPPDGAFAFFTSEQKALDYHAYHLGDGRNRMILTGESAETEPAAMMASLKPVMVKDLAKRLQALGEVTGICAWCVNPTDHREDSGFGRLWERPDGAEFQLRTVGGNWLVRPGNQFERTSDPLAWSGRDTLFWSGGQSLQLLPLDVSFGRDPIREEERAKGMSDSEADEWLEDCLSRSSVSEMLGSEEAVPSLDSFFISCWDSVMGDRYEPVPEFSGFLDALRFLSAYEREHDGQFRLDGAVTCSAIGFVGSGDEGNEALRGERFQQGLVNLGKRHLLHGYHPSYAADLVSLANATLRTLHVDFAGYAKDLLWSSGSEAVDELLENLGIDAGVWMEWNERAETFIDARGKELLSERIGDKALATLDPKVQHFLATALRHLELQGHAPQLDYAPISIEVVKGLEVEFANLLGGFRESLAGEVLEACDADGCFPKFLYEGAKAPTLGSISYLLRKPDAQASPLRVAFHRYLESLPNGDFLTSNRLAKRDLQKVINRYRNGGAHDSPIPEDTCRSCIEALVGTHGELGLIPKVAQWRSAEQVPACVFEVR